MLPVVQIKKQKGINTQEISTNELFISGRAEVAERLAGTVETNWIKPKWKI